MNALSSFARTVDAVNDWVGRTTAWLVLGAVVVAFAVVVMRKAFNVGFIWMQDLYVWQHAVVFMVGAGYTFLHGGHVRVDIFYVNAGRRGQAWIDLFGTLVFLMPWLVVVAWTSWPFIVLSWHVLEPSAQPNGLPGVFVLKTAILVFTAVLGIQGLSVIARSILTLSGVEGRAADETR